MEDIREASYSGNLVSLRNLVEYLGVDVNERHKMNGTTPLHWAVKGGYTNVISYLLSKGADPASQDNNGVSPLDLAAKSQNSVRIALGLPANENSSAPTSSSKSVDGMVASNAFVPLTPAPLPLAPLDPTTKPSLLAPINPAAPSPVTYSSAPSAVTQVPVYVAPVPQTFYVQLGNAEDVIELDLPVKSYAELVYLIYTEYQLDARSDKLIKIRKVPIKSGEMPNVLIRNDRDVARLAPGNQLQVIVQSASSQ